MAMMITADERIDGPATVRQVNDVASRVRWLALLVVLLAAAVLVLSITVALLVRGRVADEPPSRQVTVSAQGPHR